MPDLNGLLQTVILVEDVAGACRFYEEVLGLRVLSGTGERGYTFVLPGGQLLGLVSREAAAEPRETPGGVVPPRVAPAGAAHSSAHISFAVSHSQLDSWRSHLQRHGVEVLNEVQWQRGGRSLYFRDPDGHLLELATPGVCDAY